LTDGRDAPAVGAVIGTAPLIERLTQQGVLGKPRRGDRPDARGVVRARANESVSDLISEQRR
jgi:hypothetical protein